MNWIRLWLCFLLLRDQWSCLNTGSCICRPNGLTAMPQWLCKKRCQFSVFDLRVCVSRYWICVRDSRDAWALVCGRGVLGWIFYGVWNTYVKCYIQNRRLLKCYQKNKIQLNTCCTLVRDQSCEWSLAWELKAQSLGPSDWLFILRVNFDVFSEASSLNVPRFCITIFIRNWTSFIIYFLT